MPSCHIGHQRTKETTDTQRCTYVGETWRRKSKRGSGFVKVIDSDVVFVERFNDRRMEVTVGIRQRKGFSTNSSSLSGVTTIFGRGSLDVRDMLSECGKGGYTVFVGAKENSRDDVERQMTGPSNAIIRLNRTRSARHATG